MIKKTLLTLCFCLAAGSAIAQLGTDAPWMESFSENPKAAKFQDIQEAFYAYWADKDETVKGSGYKPFKRWESLNQYFLNPDGTVMTNQQKYQSWVEKQTMRNARLEDNGDWQSVGPLSHLETGSWSPGQGRVNAMAVDPNNDDILYVGAPNGGLWKSIDAGTNWEPLTDNLPQIGVSAIVVDPNNSNIIYIGTGDDDAGDSEGVGVLKSIDGGSSWNFTGLNESNSPFSFNEIFIHPSNSNILWTSSSNGVFKTVDGGDNWNLVRSGNIRDLRVHPSNPDILYCVSPNLFYKSDDGGDTWTIKNNGTPSGTNRLTIDVTPANDQVVYIFAANNSNQFEGIYKSIDEGETFTLTSNGDPGVFDGSSQSWYDFAFAVSDTDEDLIFTGIINIWRSTNAGASFAQLNSWSNPNQSSYTHADIHNLRYIGGKLYCGSDGGIYVSENDGTVFTDLTENIAIGQFYRIDVARDNSQIIAGGLQDNGGYGRSNNQWHNYYGADGMNVVIDPNDSNKMTGFIQFGGGPYISEDGGTSLATSGFPNGPDSGDWITPLGYSKDGRLLAAYRSIYQFDPVALSWTQLSGLVASGNVVEHMALDQKDDNNIYVAYGNVLRVSTDGGSTFSTLSTFSDIITWVDVDSEDNENVYVTTRGSFGKVFKLEVDEGQLDDIEDITGSLPDIPKLVIKHQAQHSDNPLFLGTSLGVWRYDDVTEDWTPFDNGLPNVTVRDLEINYTDGNITAGTYGRGIWQSAIPQEALSVDSFSSNSLRVFPNPSNGIFELQWANSSTTQLSVYDITGKQILDNINVESGSNKFNLDLTAFATGIYILKMELDNTEVTKKLIIK